jgi:hypothetical protein
MPTDRLLTPAQVADALGLNVGDVGRLISAGQIPAKHLIARGTGKRPRLRVLQSALTAFIEAMPDAVAPAAVAPAAQGRGAKSRKRALPPDLTPATRYY